MTLIKVNERKYVSSYVQRKGKDGWHTFLIDKIIVCHLKMKLVRESMSVLTSRQKIRRNGLHNISSDRWHKEMNSRKYVSPYIQTKYCKGQEVDLATSLASQPLVSHSLRFIITIVIMTLD